MFLASRRLSIVPLFYQKQIAPLLSVSGKRTILFGSDSACARHRLCSPHLNSFSQLKPYEKFGHRRNKTVFSTPFVPNVFEHCKPCRYLATGGTVSNNPFKWSALIDFDYMWVNFYSWFIATFTRGELAEVLNVWALFEVIEDYTLLVLGNIFNFNRLTYTQAENIKYFVICVLFFALFF